LDTLCSELSAEDCEWLGQMAKALELGALYSNLSEMTTQAEFDAFFDLREGLIYTNFRRNLPTSQTRLYSHMGAAHASKAPMALTAYTQSSAYRMQYDFETTRGRVYSTQPAYGAGSSIVYGGVVEPLGAHPTLLARGLAEASASYHFLASSEPGAGCVTNPFATMADFGAGAPYGESHDGFTYVRKLTPEQLARTNGSVNFLPILRRLDATRAAEIRFRSQL